jgi:cell wall-associated NlpC family hydrolase
VNYMNKLGELVTILLLLALTGSTATADTSEAEETPRVQYIYVEPEETFYDRYSNKGPLAALTLEYDYNLELVAAEAARLEEEQHLVELQEWAEADEFASTQVEIDAAIAALWPHVGVTPYGFGDTPSIWDCSGLTLWYLEQRGITDVVHSATAQVRDIRSTIVDAPIAGDLVAFQKNGSSSYFHIGVYIGGGMMIHSANPNKDTVFEAIQPFAEFENSKVAYIRY